MRISLGTGRPEGIWASFNEFLGKGDGATTAFETPFKGKELRGLHVMRNFVIIGPENLRRVTDLDGDLLRDEPDGYSVKVKGPDDPVTITFQKAPPYGTHLSCSVIGRIPEKGEAFKVLPMTDALQKQINEKLPPDMKKRKRDEMMNLPAAQDFYRECVNLLVEDARGFTGEDGAELDFKTNPAVKKAILNTLGAFVLGGFAWERSQTIQNQHQAGDEAELSD